MTAFTYSNAYLEAKDKGGVDWENDTVIAELMASGFSFDEKTHDNAAAINASRLATGNGYTQGSHAFAGKTVTRDDVNDRVDVTVNNLVITASGGSIGPTPGAIVIDTTADIVIGYITFTAVRTITDTNTLTVNPGTLRTSKS